MSSMLDFLKLPFYHSAWRRTRTYLWRRCLLDYLLKYFGLCQCDKMVGTFLHMIIVALGWVLLELLLQREERLRLGWMKTQKVALSLSSGGAWWREEPLTEPTKVCRLAKSWYQIVEFQEESLCAAISTFETRPRISFYQSRNLRREQEQEIENNVSRLTKKMKLILTRIFEKDNSPLSLD